LLENLLSEKTAKWLQAMGVKKLHLLKLDVDKPSEASAFPNILLATPGGTRLRSLMVSAFSIRLESTVIHYGKRGGNPANILALLGS
jgi:hypothetical protein